MGSAGHDPHHVGLRGESLVLFRAVWGSDAAALIEEIETSVFPDARLRHTVFQEADRLHRHRTPPATELEVPARFARRLARLAVAEGSEPDTSCFVEACIGRLAQHRAS